MVYLKVYFLIVSIAFEINPLFKLRLEEYLLLVELIVSLSFDSIKDMIWCFNLYLNTNTYNDQASNENIS